ncbi:hypothetical protein MP638_004159 [Amoeboaphelidium occidentale]|nr:hypothetical protein MP638_004159 [Amoeboaphelidium occidentale]
MRMLRMKAKYPLLLVWLACIILVLIVLGNLRETFQAHETSEKFSGDLLEAVRTVQKNNLCYYDKKTFQASVQRYAKLVEHLKTNKLLLALNLHNNDHVLPDMIIQLHIFFRRVVYHNVFVTIYESGSNDLTKALLRMLEKSLTERGIQHIITSDNFILYPDEHRIDHLAAARNRAIDQAFEMFNDVQFDRILFMNDILFCADDILELLLQSYENDADLTCGLDYDQDADGLGFYDIWVARDIKGRMFSKRPLNAFTSDVSSNRLIEEQQPFQVGCCWNGMSVIKAMPLYDNGVRFRRSHSKVLDESHPKFAELRKIYSSRQLYEECAGSERTSFCKDLHRAGYSKFIIVPKAKFAYISSDYYLLHKESPYSTDYFTSETSKISFQKMPLSMECQNLERKGTRSPDPEVVEELWI